MVSILRPAASARLLGYGPLASLLLRDGKRVSVVDRNPLSFHIARNFFDTLGDIPFHEVDFLEDTHLTWFLIC